MGQIWNLSNTSFNIPCWQGLTWLTIIVVAWADLLVFVGHWRWHLSHETLDIPRFTFGWSGHSVHHMLDVALHCSWLPDLHWWIDCSSASTERTGHHSITETQALHSTVLCWYLLYLLACYCTAQHCSVLIFIVLISMLLHCKVLYCFAMNFLSLYFIVLHWTVLW